MAVEETGRTIRQYPDKGQCGGDLTAFLANDVTMHLNGDR
jgi:hypothetical protein